MEEEKKRFYKGLFTGILSTLGVVIIVISIFLIFGKDFVYIGGTGNNELTKSIDGSQEEIFNKVKTLSYLVDKNSLYDIDDEKAIEGIYKGLFESLGDDYSAYYSPDEYKKFKESTDGEYCGIGAYIIEDAKNKGVYSLSPIEGSPAEKAGIKEGDILYQIDDTVLTDEEADKIQSMIKGEPNTEVSITIVRKDDKDKHTFKIKREKIQMPTVTYKLHDKDIANIKVSGFDGVTTKQFEEALDKAKKDNTKGMIIDLRSNPGGNLDVVVNMLEKFVKKDEMIVYAEDKSKKRVIESKSKGDKQITTPLVVLINGNSASASEIFAGNIKDHKIGKLVGEKTFGKGIVQTLLPLKDGSAVKFTTAKYFLPSGKCIHKEGIEPDVEVKLDTKEYLENKKDNQFDKGVEELRKMMK